MAIVSKKILDFKSLKKAVKQVNAQKEKEEKERKEKEKQMMSDRALFLQSIGDITPLNTSNRASADSIKPKPMPLQRKVQEKAILSPSLSDEFSVENLLDDDQSSFKREGMGPDVIKKLRRGYWIIQDELDLHGMRRDEAREMVMEFLKLSTTRGIRCIRIVHGKGHGSVNNEPVLKKLVFKWLVQREDVMAFCQAKPIDGGSGAVIVLLKGCKAI